MNEAVQVALRWRFLAALAALGLCLTSQSAVALDHSGTCTGTFAKVDNPHRLIAPCAVPAGQTLSLEAGVIVQGQNNYFEVQSGGTLNVVGTSAAQRDVQLMDATVYFDAGSAGQLKNCTIANADVGYGVYIADASPTVTNCTITSGSSGIYVTGSSLVTPAQPVLSGNSITAYSIGLNYSGATSGGTASGDTIGFPHGVTSNRVGIEVAGGAAPVLDGNTILDDTTETDVGIVLSVNPGVAVVVKNNVIHGSGADRLLDFTAGVFSGAGPTITGNQFPDGVAGGLGLGGPLTGTATLTPIQGQTTYNLTSPVYVQGSATLSVAAGVTLIGHNNYLEVQSGGTLTMAGTSAAQRDVQLLDAAVYFDAGSAGQLKNCTIANPDLSYGIYITDASPTVTNCTITSGSNGISITGASLVTPAQPVLSGNSITAYSIGLYYSGTTPGGTASGNTIGFPHGATSNRVGIEVAGGAAPVLDGNTILDDTTETDVGIVLSVNPGVAVVVKNNVIHGSGADRLLDFTAGAFSGVGPTITGNQFPDGVAGGFGLGGSLTGIATLTPIQGQSTYNLTTAVYVQGNATLSVAAGVTLLGHNNPIEVQSGGTLTMVGTSAAQRDVQLLDVPVYFDPASAGQLKNCTIANPDLGYGVFIADASPTVTTCTITAQSYGIYITGSSLVTPAQPVLSGNAITAGAIGLEYIGATPGGMASGNTIGFPHGATSNRVGIDVAGGAAPVLDGNTILDDTTETDVGIRLGVNPGVAVVVKNNVIHGSGADRLLDFTAGVFGGTGPTITGNQFPDGVAGGFGLGGALTGTATLTPIQGQTTYNLTSPVYVQGNATLSVAAGVTLLGHNNYLEVQSGATLTMAGTSAAQRDVQLMDATVYFDAGSAGQLKSCTIANPDLSYGIYIADASPTVTNCTISSASYGIYISGSSPITPAMSGNKIAAGSIGISMNGPVQPVIQDNTFSLIPIAIQIGSDSAVPTVTGNTFDRNTLSLSFESEDALFSSNPSTFDNNTFTGRADQNLMDLAFSTITQSGTIQATKVPYRVSGLTIQDGAIVTVEPGAVFDHTSFASLVVNGDLVAAGTAELPIVFTSLAPKSGTRWGGLQLHNQSPSSPSVLDSCIVEFAGNQSALTLDNSFAPIRNSTIAMNDGDGVEFINGSKSVVTDTTVADNAGNGVTVVSGGQPSFSGGTIFHNGSFGMQSEDCTIVRNIVPAINIYWGDDSGPADNNDDTATIGGLFNPTGKGDKVSDCIDYEPWTYLHPSTEGSLVAKSGGGQSGPPGSLLPNPLCVEVRGTAGGPLADIDVTFTVAQGDGDVEAPQPVKTGADGKACTSFRLGMSPGTNRVAATARDVNSPLASFDTAPAAGVAHEVFALTVQRLRARPTRSALGDMDDDGRLTLADAATMESFLAADPPSEVPADVLLRADINGDGVFDRGDQEMLLAFFARHRGGPFGALGNHTNLRASVRRPQGTPAVGEVFRVPVVIRAGREQLAAYALRVLYDANALDLLTVDGGSTPGFDEAPVIDPLAFGRGRARFAAANRGMLKTHSVVGVATLVFRAKAAGVTSVTILGGSRMPVATAGLENRQLRLNRPLKMTIQQRVTTTPIPANHW